MMTINALVFIVGIASAAESYLQLGGTGTVANDEGGDKGAFKPEDCKVEDGCEETPSDDISVEFCQTKCTGTDGCLSFAHCTGDGSDANFQRCYLKDADFSVMPHGAGDCTTYTDAGVALSLVGRVAVDEGTGLLAYKPDDCAVNCEETPSDDISVEFCKGKCSGTDGCRSFVHCSGDGSDVSFQRCYTKDRDFGVKPHVAGDCTTYYKQADLASRLYSMIPKIGAAVQIGAAALGGVAGLAAVALLAKRVLRRGASGSEESLVDDEDVE